MPLCSWKYLDNANRPCTDGATCRQGEDRGDVSFPPGTDQRLKGRMTQSKMKVYTSMEYTEAMLVLMFRVEQKRVVA